MSRFAMLTAGLLSAFALVLVCLADVSAQSKDAKPAGITEKKKPKHTNRLAKEASPYLLMHAHNPTDWHPWGPEAFEKAKKEGKLVLLSVGYSSCYWCHVMERESFDNEEVAKYLNAHFVCIKVDREQRPDIDQIYMTALNVLRQSGGWPLTMFLLPDGKPIVGGTYWPREDRKLDDGTTTPGFKTILKAIRDAYHEDKKGIEEQAEKLAAAARLRLANPAGPGIAIVPLEKKLVDDVVDSLAEEFDPTNGGFGNAARKFQGPKFPLPSRLEFLLHVSVARNDVRLRNSVFQTLDAMALGGIYDHVGGGFHRYTVEPTWTTPHFEKMLYDNAQLVSLYSRAYAVKPSPLYKKVVEETLGYIEREMTSPEGAFYSSQDAETEEEEGRFYVWTPEELVQALPDGDERSLIQSLYLTEKPNFEGKYHILRLKKPLSESAKERKIPETDLLAKVDLARRKLYDSRAKRARPFRNEISLTAWSGQMIGAYADAGRIFKREEWLASAKKAARFVLQHQRTNKRTLLRTYGAAPGEKPKAAVDGYLEDYSLLAQGLLDLYDATKEKAWLDAARDLTDAMIANHSDPRRGGFFVTSNEHEELFARAKDQYDGAQPSGNGSAARNLVRLARITGDRKYAAEAGKTLRSFAAALRMQTSSMSMMALALDLHLAATPSPGRK